jgi:uncharacterized protein with HEPN domain
MKDDKVFLIHILQNIEKIENSMKNRTKTDFKKDLDLQDAITRRIEIIGEAVKNISEKTKKINPDVNWRGIAGMRDKLIHFYFGIDLEITFEIIKKDIPILKKQVQRILGSITSSTQ